MDIGIPGLLAGQTDDLVDNLVELDLADRWIRLAREAQKLVGDFLATIALRPNLADGARDLLEIVSTARITLGEQVVDPAGLLNHDGDRVVDLVSDAGSELSDGGETAGFDDLMGHYGPLAVSICKPLGEIARDHIADEYRGKRDDDQDDDRKPLDTPMFPVDNTGTTDPV